MAETGNPILLSTGMSPLSEIDKMVQVIRDLGAPILLFQSTTSYPCPPEKIGLNMISLFRDRYGCPVGLSDHSGTIYAGLAAATVGIDILEVHVAFHRSIFGPDVPASLTPEELKQLVEGIRFVETMRQNPVDKDAVASDLSPLRDLFFKSVVASTDIPAGSVLNRSQLTTKKPGMGIPADRLDEVVGRTLVRDMERDEAIREEDLAAPA